MLSHYLEGNHPVRIPLVVILEAGELVLLKMAGYEQTNLHFGVDGYHSMSYQSTRLEKTVAEVGWNRYSYYSCCCFGDGFAVNNH